MRLHFAAKQKESADTSVAISRVVNFYPEPVDRGQTGFDYVLVPTPGLESINTGMEGDGRGVYAVPGAANDQLIAIAGAKAYAFDSGYVRTELGDVTDGTDRARFASAGATQLAIATAGDVYVYDNSSLTKVTDPELPTVADLTYGNGRYAVTQAGAGSFFFSGIDAPSSWEALDFLTPTDSPDDSRGIRYHGDTLFILGARTTELWAPTGDSSVPFRPMIGAVIEKGVLAKDAYAVADNAIHMVDHNRTVQRITSGGAQRVSDHDVEEALNGVDEGDVSGVEVYSWSERGHEFLCVVIPGAGTRVLDIASGAWFQLATYGRDQWRPRDLVRFGRDTVAVDRAGASLYRTSRASYFDGGDPIVRVATVGDPVLDGNQDRNSVVLRAAMGEGLDGSGQGSDPLVSLRWSDDRGKSWSNSLQRSVGQLGEYSQVARWNGLGSVRAPGRVWELSYSDPIPLALYGLDMNVEHA